MSDIFLPRTDVDILQRAKTNKGNASEISSLEHEVGKLTNIDEECKQSGV